MKKVFKGQDLIGYINHLCESAEKIYPNDVDRQLGLKWIKDGVETKGLSITIETEERDHKWPDGSESKVLKTATTTIDFGRMPIQKEGSGTDSCTYENLVNAAFEAINEELQVYIQNPE